MLRWLVFLIGFFGFAAAGPGSAAPFEEGVHYHWVAPGQSTGDKIEVIEFFWYGCPHCFSFEPFLDEWLQGKPDDVEFVKMPATFDRPEVKMHAKAFYALEMLGVPAQIHNDIMEEMHNKKNPLGSEEAMEGFLSAKGIDIAAYRDALNSFAVYVKVQQAAQLAQRYGVSGVPSLVVDGQYRNGSLKSYDDMIALLDFLIDEARGRRGAN
jgi:thiol:disulfide interchange protein DsbA